MPRILLFEHLNEKYVVITNNPSFNKEEWEGTLVDEVTMDDPPQGISEWPTEKSLQPGPEGEED